MTVRNPDTLRRMWEEALHLRADAEKLFEEEEANRRDAQLAEQHAEAARTSALAIAKVVTGKCAEAADLVEIVNRLRSELGMPELELGQPYDPEPADPSGETRTDLPTPVVESRGEPS